MMYMIMERKVNYFIYVRQPVTLHGSAYTDRKTIVTCTCTNIGSVIITVNVFVYVANTWNAIYAHAIQTIHK